MKKLSNKIILGIIAIIAMVTVIIFAIDWRDTGVEKINQKDTKDVIIDSESFVDQTLSTKELREMLSSASLDESEMQEWEIYTSEKLRISFMYPPEYMVVERGEVGTDVSLRIFEDTPHNRHVEKILNPDFEYVIPEDQRNLDFEPWSQVISFNKSIEGGFTQDIVEWYRENKSGKNADNDVYTSVDFIGIDSVVYQAEGLFAFDGVMFERGGYLYQFIVQYFNSPESPRDNFYKIISTITINTAFKPNGTVSVNLCGNDILADSIVLNGVNIIKTMERIGGENYKLSLCDGTGEISSNFFGETIGVAVKEWRWANDGHYISKKEKSETNVYIAVLYSKNDERQSSDPFNQSTFIYKFDFNNNQIYTQSQFDGSFHQAGIIIAQ